MKIKSHLLVGVLAGLVLTQSSAVAAERTSSFPQGKRLASVDSTADAPTVGSTEVDESSVKKKRRREKNRPHMMVGILGLATQTQTKTTMKYQDVSLQGTSRGGVLPGVGASFDLPISRSMYPIGFGLEFDLFFVQRQFELYKDTYLDSSWIMISALPKLWITKYVALGLGGYTSRSIGTARSKERAYELRSTADHGLTTSAGLHIPFQDDFNLLVEGRYNLGLSNISRSDNVNGVEVNSKVRDINAILGVKINLN